MKILLITADGYDDSEVLYPYFRLLEEDFQVDVASFQKGPVNGKYHFVIQADRSFEMVCLEEYDGLMIPGGKAPEKIRQNGSALDAVRYFMEKGLPVAAICHGQQILISAHVLNGKRCTCYPGIKDDVINAGGIYKDQKVVIDGNLVTSRRPEDLPQFMKEFVKMLSEKIL
jgi:protease I